MFRYAPLYAPYSIWWSGWLFTPMDRHHGHYSFFAEWRCCCNETTKFDSVESTNQEVEHV